MSGTRAGGLKQNETLLKQHGSPEALRAWRKELGRMGGKAPHKEPRGFASDVVGKDGLDGPTRARIAGEIGGKRSARRRWSDEEVLKDTL